MSTIGYKDCWVRVEDSNFEFFSIRRTIFLQAFAGTDEIGNIYEKLINEVEHCLQNLVGSQAVISSSNCQVAALHNLLEALLIGRRSRDVLAAIGVLQKASSYSVWIFPSRYSQFVSEIFSAFVLIQWRLITTVSLKGKTPCVLWTYLWSTSNAKPSSPCFNELK